MKEIKYIFSLFSLVFFFPDISMFAQIDTSYFNKLSNEKIESSDILEWKQFGPGMSGYCEEFWCHPTQKGVMFMGPDMHVSYGSWNNGASWQTIKDCDGTGQDMKRVLEMDFSRSNPNFGLALDWNGDVYATYDCGHKWNLLSHLQKRHSAIAVDPNNDKIWYAGAGDFWNVKDNHRSLSKPHGIILSKAAHGHICKSSDGGKSWQILTKGLPDSIEIGKIIVDPRNSSVIYMATNYGFYKSKDSGISWSCNPKGLNVNLPRDLDSFYDKKTGELILYLIDQTYFMYDNKKGITWKGGVYKSSDEGEHWGNITGNIPIDFTKIDKGSINGFQYRNMLTYWFGKSNKNLNNILNSKPKSMIPVFNRIVVNPKNKNEIYITQNAKHDFTFPLGEVMKTEDGGKHWTVCARTGIYWKEKKDSVYWKSKGNPLGDNMKFAHLQREMDERDFSSGNRFMNINSDGDVYICVDQQLLRSANGGKSWEQIDDYETNKDSNKWIGRGDSDLPGRFILLETGKKNRALLCSGEHGLWQTTDLGNYKDKTAVAVKQLDGQCIHNGAHSIASVAVNPKNPNEIYSLVFRQAHRGAFRCSSDGGRTWNDRSIAVPYSNKDLSGKHIYQYSLLVDHENEKNICFCVMRQSVTEVGEGSRKDDFNGYGVYISNDEGYTWRLSNNGLPSGCSVNRLSLDPSNHSVIYAALNKCGKVNGGLYLSYDFGANWHKMEIPNEIISVNNVFVDKHTSNIFISCGTAFGEKEAGGVWRSEDKGKTWNKIFEMPYVWQAETSHLDTNIIIVSSAGSNSYKNHKEIINPGAYLSVDNGKHWIKINKNLGQPDKIVDIKPDIYNPKMFWCALWGSGWYRGILNK